MIWHWWAFPLLRLSGPRNGYIYLSKAGAAAAHDFALADELSVEFAAVEGEEDVKVDACDIRLAIHFSGLIMKL